MGKKRYPLPDMLRGLILVSMVLYHLTWDIVNLFGADWAWFRSDVARVWQQSIAWSFILLSGFCWSFGKTKWKRGVVVFVGGAVITLATLLVMPEERVIFGVLTFLGAAMLVMIPLDRLLRNCSPYMGAMVSAGLFVLFRNVREGYLSFERWNWVPLPKGWYANIATAFFGFPPDSFFSQDYFPFMPWIFLFCVGYFLHKIAVRRDLMRYLAYGKCAPLEFLGRHSLMIYMAHQPVLYGLCTLMLLQ